MILSIFEIDEKRLEKKHIILEEIKDIVKKGFINI
jgi:hypothetical protein|tara:strand:- start:942 stop:1046 length:105 start_codon:yes stop_codon:yes gene_type:complete